MERKSLLPVRRWLKQPRLYGNPLVCTPRDLFITVGLYMVTVVACLLLRSFDRNNDSSYVAMLFLTDVFLTAVLTDGYLFSLVCAVMGVLSVDYIFTEPYWKISFTLTGFPLTFLVMMTISVLAGAMASRAKRVESMSRQAQKEKMRANLLRSMSHDIRTPLTGIVGATDVLLERWDKLTDQQRHSLLQSVNDDANWLMRVTENLLSITRMDGDGARVRKTPEAMEEVVESAVAKFRRYYDGMQVAVHLPDELLMVPMDALLMQQVLFNLMENAARHGETARHIDLTLYRKGTMAVVEVADDGVGIAPEKLPQLFSGTLGPGVRGDEHRDMGIGLSVCKTVVQAHGGTIEAMNQNGGGALFRIYLPLEEEEKDEN